jgi:hypothetical protein
MVGGHPAPIEPAATEKRLRRSPLLAKAAPRRWRGATYHPAVTASTEAAGVSVHGLAPWARRRGRLVQFALIGGSIALAFAFVATLSGPETVVAGVILAIATLVLGLGAAAWLQRLVPRVRLEIGDAGVSYDAGTHRIEAAWEDVAALDLVIRGSDSGPALVLRSDRAVSGRGMLGVGDIGGALGGTGFGAPSLKSTIPLAAFIEGGLAGSAVEADLRRHIPALVDGYLARYPDRRR